MELIHHRGEHPQAELLEQWLAEVLQTYGDRVLDLDGDGSDLPHDLTVVTRNIDDLAGCGVQLLNPFQPPP